MKNWMLLLLLLASFTTNAATPLPKDKVEDFFNSIVSGKISDAYDKLFIGSSIPQDKPQAVTLLKQQTENGLPLYGKLLGYEYISEESFGSSIVRYVCVLKSEKGPTVWEFFFYKPKNEWFLANVIFNDQFTFLR